MHEIAAYSDLFEMIAAIAALVVAVIFYLETRNMRSEFRAEIRQHREEMDALRAKLRGVERDQR